MADDTAKTADPKQSPNQPAPKTAAVDPTPKAPDPAATEQTKQDDTSSAATGADETTKTGGTDPNAGSDPAPAVDDAPKANPWPVLLRYGAAALRATQTDASHPDAVFQVRGPLFDDGVKTYTSFVEALSAFQANVNRHAHNIEHAKRQAPPVNTGTRELLDD